MTEPPETGVGKCANHHLGSFGFPTRPPEPYGFCPQCGEAMVWRCGSCGELLPEDPQELETAKYCRSCGASYFVDSKTEE